MSDEHQHSDEEHQHSDEEHNNILMVKMFTQNLWGLGHVA